MGLVVASATFDLETLPAARGPQQPGSDDGEFAGVLAGRLGKATGQPGGPGMDKKLKASREQDASADADLEDAPAEEPKTDSGLPLMVATWLATSPVLDPLSGGPASEGPGAATGAPPPATEGPGAATGALPPATVSLSTPGTAVLGATEGDDAAGAGAPQANVAGAVLPAEAPAAGDADLPVEGKIDPAPAVSSAPVAIQDAGEGEQPVTVATAPETETETETETPETTSAAVPAVEAVEGEDAPAPRPAPGLHAEQSNRPDALPGDAGRNAVEALQRVAVKHEEQGKSPPGQQPGGNGMPTIAASVVRSVGNAETDTSTSGGGPQNEKHGDQGNSAAAGSIAAAGLSAPAAPETVAAGADVAPAPATAPEPPIEQVGRAVLEQVTEGGGEARIRLDPPELGEIAIRVRIENHQVRVDIRVERPEALQLLRNAQVDLSSLLGDRGLNLADMFTTLSQGQSGSAWGDEMSQQNQRPADRGFAAILGIDEPDAAISQHRKLRGAYNPDGAHDYRV